MTTQLRVLGVSRLSAMNDATSSPERQRALIDGYVERIGGRLVGVAEDLNVSAIKVPPFERPALKPWLEDPSQFDVMAFWRVDRVARSVTDFSRLLDHSKEHGYRLVSLDPEMDFEDAMGRVFGVLLSVFAEMEGQSIKERVALTRRHNRALGKWQGLGSPLFGYKKVPHPGGSGYALDLDPEKAPVVRDMYSRFVAGDSAATIAGDLNDKGIPTPRNKGRWHATTVYKILKAESLRNLVRDVDGEVVRQDDGSPLRYGPPLLSDTEFRRLQATLAARSMAPGRARREGSLLLGVVFCELCGAKMYRGGKPDKRVYFCPTPANTQGREKCPTGSILAEPVDKWAVEQYLYALEHTEISEVSYTVGVDRSAEIAALDESLDDLMAARFERRVKVDTARWERQVERLQVRLDALRAEHTESLYSEDLSDRTFRDLWDGWSQDQRRASMKKDHYRVLVGPGVRFGDPLDRVRAEFGGWSTLGAMTPHERRTQQQSVIRIDVSDGRAFRFEDAEESGTP